MLTRCTIWTPNIRMEFQNVLQKLDRVFVPFMYTFFKHSRVRTLHIPEQICSRGKLFLNQKQQKMQARAG